jgi:hypothetical protein
MGNCVDVYFVLPGSAAFHTSLSLHCISLQMATTWFRDMWALCLHRSWSLTMIGTHMYPDSVTEAASLRQRLLVEQ